jgi:hypothetical protein
MNRRIKARSQSDHISLFVLIQVLEAEKYYFQLTTETLRNARIQVISRGFVWSVEVSPGKLERYSYKINEQIEDARSKNLPNVCNSLLFICIYSENLRLIS